MQSNPPAYDLSVLLDMETLKITGEILLDDRVSLWLEAARRVAPRTFEFIICSSQPLEGKVDLPPDIKLMVAPGLGYYAMKNAGAKKAEGKIIFWGDVDCRPDPNYLVNLLAHYDANPDLNIIGGRTFYDGDDFATRVNTAVSWGYLHGIEDLDKGGCFVGHNVSVRNGSLPDYFGPYTERYGGDEFITARHRLAGDKLPVFQDLMLYHESPAHSLRGLLDRQFREIGRLSLMASPDGTISTGLIFQEARKNRRGRWGAFKKHASKIGIGRNEWWKARMLFWYYGLVNLVAASAMVLRPSLLKKWTTYQFGDLKKCKPVAKEISLLLQKPA